MKMLNPIFKTAQLTAIDRYTIEHEPIKSIDLMERAAPVSYTHLDVYKRQGRIRKRVSSRGRDYFKSKITHQGTSLLCKMRDKIKKTAEISEEQAHSGYVAPQEYSKAADRLCEQEQTLSFLDCIQERVPC